MAAPAHRRSGEIETRSRKAWRASLPDGGTGAAVIPFAATAKRRIALFDLLVWAYRDQKVHRVLRRPIDWIEHEIAEGRLLGDMTPSPQVHRDAALVHLALLRVKIALGPALGEPTAELLVDCACAGEPPERSSVEPLPQPTEPPNRQDYDYCRGMWQGRLTDALVIVVETITEMRPKWVRDGRKRMRQDGVEIIRTEVEWCPIDWRPDPHFVAMLNDMADRFERGMALLRRKLKGAELTAHVIEER